MQGDAPREGFGHAGQSEYIRRTRQQESSRTPVAVDAGLDGRQESGRALDIIDKRGLDYRLNSMGTVLEGEWDDVMAVAKKCFDVMKRDARRIEFSMKGDWRKGLNGRLSGKVDVVEKMLGRKLRK